MKIVKFISMKMRQYNFKQWMKITSLCTVLLFCGQVIFPAENDSMQKYHPDGIIVFETMRFGEGINFFEVYSMTADGTNQTRLTDNSIYDGMPSVSARCNKIAFVSTRDGNYEIYTMNTDGRNTFRLTNNNSYDFSPKWSPDGSKIAFCSHVDGNGNIYIVDPDGTNLTRLTDNVADDDCPDWSPEGNQIVFSSTRNGGGKELFIMNADDTNQTQITSLGHDNYQADWSPDGQKIVFMTDKFTNGGTYDIATINVDGSNLQRLTSHSAHDEMPEWSPNGNKIAFFSSILASEEIHVMNIDGTDIQRLTNTPGFDYPHDWTLYDTLSNVLDKSLYQPKDIELFQSYPNPFHSKTTVSFKLKAPAKLSFELYNQSGNKMWSFAKNKLYTKGKHEIKIDGSALAEGFYTCILISETGYTARSNIILIK